MKIFLALISTLVFSFASIALAKTAKVDLVVTDGFVFLPLKGSNATAGYGILRNQSSEKITLSVVSAEGFKATELHETVEEKGLMKMKKVESFAIEPKGSFELKPGGNHIMLFDALKELRDGETVSVTFQTNKGPVKVPFKLKPRTETPDPHAHHH
ncbi:MAG: copper chaperone PCu(A)C [Bdellovibrionaceae bacterium]|nr:copper chaperone PCu(A)C [Pseudobdellovibrionaceae bacterium]